MPRITFTSGDWVEYREQIDLFDKFEVARAMKFETEKGKPSAVLGAQNDGRNAMLGRLITAWSYQVPIPEKNSFAAADKVMTGVMSIDDYDELTEEVEPLLSILVAEVGKAPERIAAYEEVKAAREAAGKKSSKKPVAV